MKQIIIHLTITTLLPAIIYAGDSQKKPQLNDLIKKPEVHIALDVNKGIPRCAELTTHWTPTHIVQGHTACYSPDEQHIATGFKNNLQFWDCKTGNRIHNTSISHHSDRINSVTYSPTGSQLASASNDKTVTLWNPTTGHPSYVLGHTDWINNTCYTPNGKLIATESFDGYIGFWETATGKSLRTLSAIAFGVHQLRFSPNGKQLAVSSWSNYVQLFDTETGQETQLLQGHTNWVKSIRFSSDNRLIATTAGDGTKRTWDTTSGNELFIQEDKGKGHFDPIVSSASDRKRALPLFNNTQILLWEKNEQRNCEEKNSDAT